jgi:hypothetical protein
MAGPIGKLRQDTSSTIGTQWPNTKAANSDPDDEYLRALITTSSRPKARARWGGRSVAAFCPLYPAPTLVLVNVQGTMRLRGLELCRKQAKIVSLLQLSAHMVPSLNE